MTVKELPKETILIKLANDSYELGLAALELVRGGSKQTLLEKIAEVNVCLVALDPDPYAVEAIMRQKACEWERKVNEQKTENDSSV